ncbi:putative deoxyribonuclease TATDN3 [Aquarana catesbeiana]|uniref:putative deoxyribonuclease TATDN3 n=1 Tax=Aquarana catesbeiana TaxID=8400 RepID=UPI003CC9AABA
MEGGAGGWGGACAVRVHAELETDRCLEVLARGAGMELNGGMVDCHCHLSAAEFNQDIDNILQEARTAGVRALVAVAEHAAEFEKLIQLSRRNAGLVFPCLGVHPVQTETSEQQRSATLQDLEDALPLFELYKDELVAIGEVGLDFTPRIASTDDQKEEQRQVFIRQIELAKHLGLPLNVHSRSAGRPTINLLKEQGTVSCLIISTRGDLLKNNMAPVCISVSQSPVITKNAITVFPWITSKIGSKKIPNSKKELVPKKRVYKINNNDKYNS